MAIKDLLKERGLRQRGVAEAVGVSEPTFSRWVHGQIPAEKVPAVAAAMGVPKHALRPDLFDAPSAGPLAA